MNAVLNYLNKAQAEVRAKNAIAAAGKPAFVLNSLNEYVVIRPLVCADGFQISVQASSAHYCAPRDSQGPWIEVECGFPSEDVPTLAEYKESDGPDGKSVFAWTPIELVNELIASHGGIKE